MLPALFTHGELQGRLIGEGFARGPVEWDSRAYLNISGTG